MDRQLDKQYFLTRRYEKYLEGLRKKTPGLTWKVGLEKTVKSLGGEVLTAGIIFEYKDCGCGVRELCYSWASWPRHEADIKLNDTVFRIVSHKFPK